MNNKKLQITFLIFASLLIFLGRQLDNGIQNFDDAYYAQKGKEVLNPGPLWLITHTGIPAFDNPPIPFWSMALAFSVFGVSTYSAIFSSALFGTGTIFLTYRLSLLLYKDCWIAFASAFVLLFPGLFVDASRRSMVDIPLAFFVTLAFYAFFKARDQNPWYLIYGLATACAILTKSVLGLFPLTIIGIFLILSRQWREIINPWFLSGCLIALTLGFSWHFINWQNYGQGFIDVHFGYLIGNRNFGAANPFYFLGYAKDFYRNYWPWLPITLIGLAIFAKRGFKDKDRTSLLLFLWPMLTFLVMSTGKNQVIRYLFMMFPALAIINAKTISEWLKPDKKNVTLGIMTGVIAICILFVNVTFFRVKVSLDQQSKEVREISSIIKLNTTENQKIGNYYLSPYNPRITMMFYASRVIELNGIRDAENLTSFLSVNPGKVWLSPIEKFREFTNQHPGKAYLIKANSKYTFFTSMENRKNIRYDFSNTLPTLRTTVQKESSSLDTSLLNNDGKHASITECQEAIKQLDPFITHDKHHTERPSVGLPICITLPPACYTPHKKFPRDLYLNVVNTCGIGSALGGRDYNTKCTEQLQSFKRSVDMLIIGLEAANTPNRINTGTPYGWSESEANCINNGQCEFQLDSTRYAMVESYFKVKSACKIG